MAAASRSRVLVVDDEEVMQDVLGRLIEGAGWEATIVADAETGLQRLSDEEFDLVLLDLMLPGLSGMDALERIRRSDPELPVIMITAHATVATAIEAMKRGAFDYQVKPFRNDELVLIAKRGIAARRLRAENRSLRQRLRDKHKFENIVGRSPAMQRVFELIVQASPSRSTILIEGESGTGKELVASAVHAQSPRSAAPFVVVNCGNLSPELQESTLFGHVKGAFPAATQARKGLFETADGGSLFFDDVTSLGLDVQARLLRAIQEREIVRVGSNEVQKIDVRIIAATHADLSALVSGGSFREDLYWRLNVIRIPLPPLREREGDVPLLAAHFLQLYARENGKKIHAIAPAALEALERYAWPGNVRELENLIQRAVVLCRGDEIREDLIAEALGPGPGPLRARPVPAQGNYKDVVDGFERDIIVGALREAQGIQKKAAEQLGLKPTTLNEKIKRLGIRYRES